MAWRPSCRMETTMRDARDPSLHLPPRRREGRSRRPRLPGVLLSRLRCPRSAVPPPAALSPLLLPPALRRPRNGKSAIAPPAWHSSAKAGGQTMRLLLFVSRLEGNTSLLGEPLSERAIAFFSLSLSPAALNDAFYTKDPVAFRLDFALVLALSPRFFLQPHSLSVSS